MELGTWLKNTHTLAVKELAKRQNFFSGALLKITNNSKSHFSYKKKLKQLYTLTQ